MLFVVYPRASTYTLPHTILLLYWDGTANYHLILANVRLLYHTLGFVQVCSE